MAVSSRAGAPQAFELKSASLNLLALHLKTPDLAELAEAIAQLQTLEKLRKRAAH